MFVWMTAVSIVIKDISLNFVMLIGVTCSLCYEMVTEQNKNCSFGPGGNHTKGIPLYLLWVVYWLELLFFNILCCPTNLS